MPVHWCERMHAREQQKARLNMPARQFNGAEHKARARPPIKAGGLVWKIGLLDLDVNTLFRALGQTALWEIKITMPAKPTWAPSKRIYDASASMCALFGANFREARLKARMTQADVEQLTGIRQHYVSEIELGLQNPTLYTMAALAGAIATEVRSLLRPPPKRG